MIVVIDSKQFYYEFVFNKWLNATQSGMIGRVHQEASLTRKYGGPHSKEYFSKYTLIIYDYRCLLSTI
ncbi:hypothetical protein AC249_AIPGENE24755 [Exaiptasia diaphana]|nr:hypothetical protein AC249_AIPGENE24755 [Exaiptasia diaphana]